MLLVSLYFFHNNVSSYLYLYIILLCFAKHLPLNSGEYMALHGFRIQSKTAHPKYGGYRNKSPLWKATKVNNTIDVRKFWNKNDNDRKKKLWFCHVYRLPYQRKEDDEKFLKSRIIIKRKYEKHWRAIYDPYKKKKNKR